MGDVYWNLKESVGKYELLLLRAIKFDLKVKLPHPVSKEIYSGTSKQMGPVILSFNFRIE